MDAFTTFLQEIQDEEQVYKEASVTAAHLSSLDYGQLSAITNAVRGVDHTKVSHVVPMVPQAPQVPAGYYPHGLTHAEADIMNKVSAVDFAARQIARNGMDKSAGRRADRKKQRTERQAANRRSNLDARADRTMESAPKKTHSARGPVQIIGGNSSKTPPQIITPGPKERSFVQIDKPGPNHRPRPGINIDPGKEGYKSKSSPSRADVAEQLKKAPSPPAAETATKKVPSVTEAATKKAPSAAETAVETAAKKTKPGWWGKMGRWGKRGVIAGGTAAAGLAGYGAYRALKGRKKAASRDLDSAIRRAAMER